MTDTDAVLINTEDHSIICCSSVSLKVRKEGKKKSIHADCGNTEKLQRWTYTKGWGRGNKNGKL